jgi:folate-binding protein YgfZ
VIGRRQSHGDVTGEYLALRRAAGVVGDAHEIVWVRGADAVEFLDGLLSQAIAPIAAGRVERSLLLSPQGKLRAIAWLLRGEAEVGLVVDAGRAGVVADDLARFKIRVDATIDVEAGTVLDVIGPDAPSVVARIGGSGADPGVWRRGADGTVVAPLPFRRVDLARFVVVPAGDELELDARPVGSLAHAAIRIEAGEAVMGIDLDEATIPQEADVVDGAVDFAKGCYLGQELVARIESRGRVNRRLRGLTVSTNVLPPLGATLVSSDGATVGTITSLAESLELRAPVALALVRREVTPGDTVTVQWEGATTLAVVHDLPLDHFDAEE